MKKKFTTIRSRITLTTITLCIFLSIAVSYISYSFYYKSVKQNMIRTAESSLTLLGSSIDSNIQDAYSFVRNCQANSFILNYLSSQGSQSARITASSAFLLPPTRTGILSRLLLPPTTSPSTRQTISGISIFLTATTAVLPILIAKVS